MIDPVSSSFTNLPGAGGPGLVPGAGMPVRLPDQMRPAEGPASIGPTSRTAKTQFSDVLGGLINSVEQKNQVAQDEARRLMLGQSDNIHRSMIAMQESGLAFSLLVEVRNKLVESYQELMRMSV